MGEKIKKHPVFLHLFSISAGIILFFCSTVNDLNESSYNWLSASAIKFTNNWLNDGITADKYTMLEKPLSIESQNIMERNPYISYPNGTILLTYGIAKIFGYKQIDMDFIKPFSTVFYLLDALLIGILIYLILVYIVKLKSKYGKIILPLLLSCLWICFPNNVYFLKNVFFADQLVLVFIYMLLLLELLKNYANITRLTHQRIIHTLLFFTILCGMLVEYYFWIQLFILCLINFIDSRIKKEKGTDSLKKLSIYVIPALLAIGLFIFQLVQIDNWGDILVGKFTERTGQSNLIAGNYILRIGYHVYQTYQSLGLLLFLASIVALVFLSFIVLKKERLQNKVHDNLLKFSFLIILPAYIQLIVFMNHSAVHEFPVLKLGLPFLMGLILISYTIYMLKKKSELHFIALTTVLVTGYLLFNQWNIAHFYNERVKYDETAFLRGFEPIVAEMNSYETVFFSFTDSIPINPPLSIAQTQKMIYKIDKLTDINNKFPDLDDEAVIMIVVNKNAKKSNQTINEEQLIKDRSKRMKETDRYTIYKLPK
ncbi:MAG: hypothetical protein LBO74_17230 [Candidatus Symbiothrix sp.]|jgi:hypothetical protein|nr:hypothetical protein [Candidatus Symbiothrix sp.]